MTAPITAPAAPQSRNANVEQGTEYVILSRNTEAGRVVYVHEKNVTARDTNQAIEKYAQGTGVENKDAKAGTFIAIPASRWKPVRVTPQTVTTLKLEEAK